MYLAFYLAIISIVLIACPQGEAPTLPCKKKDQSGTICLDGAQTSAPATAATPQPSGMTQAQMLEMMRLFKENHQQTLNSIPSTMSVSQAIGNTKDQLEARKLHLQQENVRLKSENDASDSQTTIQNNEATIAKNNLEINFINERLASIAEATKDPNILQQIGNRAIGECFNSFLNCLGKLGQGTNWLWEKTPWGGKKEVSSYAEPLLPAGGAD